MAGAKDDRLDAYVLADALRTYRPRFRQVDVDHPLVIQIRELSRVHEDLREELNPLTNRLPDQIHRCAPHCSGCVGLSTNPGSGSWPSESSGLVPGPGFKVVPSSTVASGTAEAVRAHIGLLMPRLRVVHDQRRRCLRQLEALLGELAEEYDDDGPSDLEILRSVPGIGTLMAEAASLIAQRDGATLRSYGGPAPITRRSGKSWLVFMRRGCNQRLRDAFYHWARVSTMCDPAARAYYAQLRARGHTHGRALRSVADRWLRILMAMLNSRTLYDPNHQRRLPAAA